MNKLRTLANIIFSKWGTYVHCCYKLLWFFKSSGDDLYVVDESGKQLPALTVFSESLKYLKQSLLEEAKKQQTDIRIDDIKWILTVPAIWSDPAKAFMRTAAIEVYITTFNYEKKRVREREIISTFKSDKHFFYICVTVLDQGRFDVLQLHFTGWYRL